MPQPDSVSSKLSQIANDLSNDRAVPSVTTREFLSWFSAQRRGFWVVQWIKRELEKAELETVPDFRSAYIDSPITFIRLTTVANKNDSTDPIETLNAPIEAAAAESASIAALVSKDPTYRISKLDAANQMVVSVTPDSSLQECITLLLSRDFSQLPVMNNARNVLGIVSWKSIGYRLALSKSTSTAHELMIPHHEIRVTASIFEAIPLIVANEYVLVRGEQNQISGIITATDLSQQFRILSEPFLLIGEIENLIRVMIGDRFTQEELTAAKDPLNSHTVSSPADLSFGEYIRLLQSPDRWTKLAFSLDRKTFCEDLENIREIRNNVMHFDPEGIEDRDLNKLRDFTSFLKQLQAILPVK